MPTGVYFDPRGRGRWYVQYRDEAGKLKTQRIADARETLAGLRRIMEKRNGINRGTLRHLAQQFHESTQFGILAAKTQQDYEYCKGSVLETPTKLGKPLGDLPAESFTRELIQRLVDRIADAGTPSKANHILRYLRRLFRWGINRGYCSSNPAQGVESAREKRRRRLPELDTISRLTAFAKERGLLPRQQHGACAPYIWVAMEIAYICRLRGVEVVTLTDANSTPEGVLTNRRKGSRDSIIRWYPRLSAAWQAAADHRAKVWKAKGREVPARPGQRPLIVAADGEALRKSSFDSAWQRFMRRAIAEGVIDEAERFGLHDLKRRGITDTQGSRHTKQEASGHRSAAMMDVYDLSVPLVDHPVDARREA